MKCHGEKCHGFEKCHGEKCCSFESLSALYARLFTTNSFSMSFTTYQQPHVRITQNVAIIQMLLSSCACSVAFLLTAFAALLIYIYIHGIKNILYSVMYNERYPASTKKQTHFSSFNVTTRFGRSGCDFSVHLFV